MLLARWRLSILYTWLTRWYSVSCASLLGRLSSQVRRLTVRVVVQNRGARVHWPVQTAVADLGLAFF